MTTFVLGLLLLFLMSCCFLVGIIAVFRLWEHLSRRQ